MNLLLDENLDWRLGRELVGHATASVPLIGWAGVKNGVLLRKADAQYDVLITMDKGIYHQQNLAGMRLIVIALRAKTNRLADTKPLVPKLLLVLNTAQAGEYHTIT
jgi:predicted nuclease of predicted toxin-antitoxin system